MLTTLRSNLAYFSGAARVMARWTGGAGVILRLQRVRPPRRDAFQPLQSDEIPPRFLDAMLRKLRRWKYDVVSIDEVCRRAALPRSGRQFVCLTFDGGYRDLIDHAWPVLTRHDVPFAVYLPTAFPDGLGQAWWLALEDIIDRHDRIGLMMDQTERYFNARSLFEKYQVFGVLDGWMRTLTPQAVSDAINDLCTRYSVNLAALSRDAFMNWDEVLRLAGDPRVTIGTATVNYPVLNNVADSIALREMSMGRAVALAALGRDPRHFAYPFGDPETYGERHVAMTQDAGFFSAVTARPGIVQADGLSPCHALPRMTLDGRRRSLRALRVRLSGIGRDAT